MAAQAKEILSTFLRRLTNLSGNNRSLLLLRLVSDQFIDIHSLSHLNGVKSFEVIRALVKGNEYRLCAVHDSRLESNNIASQKLKMLNRADHFVFEERGTRDLHVGWPFVRGKFSDGTMVRCPLLFFPVRLVQKNQAWILESRSDAGITFNKTFLLAYAFYHKLKADDDLLDFSFDDFDRDITVFRTQLYELLKNRIELNFNAENFTDELSDFIQFRKTEFDERHGTGQLKLFPEAVIGLFPQAGSQLVPDYLHLMDDESFHDLEDFFSKARATDSGGRGENAPQQNPLIREENLYTPFSLDAWQENAIHEIKKGRSVVVQGPPGTGKSQLICNLLSDAMASGKRVLLVCQKRAALDVVYERMDKKGLSSFLALVHDFRNDRKEIYAKIARQVERIGEFKARNRSVDVIQMERNFVKICRNIDHITEELQDFKDALYNEMESGVSVKHLYLHSDPSQPAVNLKQEYHHFMLPPDAFLKRLRRYSRYAALYETPGHPWRERKSFAGLQASDQARVERVIDDVLACQHEISGAVEELTGAKLNLDDCEGLWYRHEEILGMLSLLKDNDSFSFFQRMNRESDDETSMLWLSNMERVVMNCFDEIGPEVTIPTEKLGKFQEALHERMKTGKNLLRKIQWELFSENKFVVKRALVANDLAYNKYGLSVLEQRIDTRLNLEHHLTALKNRPWLLGIPQDYRKQSLQQWFNVQKQAIRAKLIFRSFREIRESINPDNYSRTEFHKVMRQLLDLLKDIPAKKEEWTKWLSLFHVKKLVVDESFSAVLKTSLRKDFDNLCEFDALKEEVAGVEENVISKLQEFSGSWDENHLEDLFINSVSLAWIDHIEMKYPVLRSVSSMRMEELQKELAELIAEKRRLSLEILLLRARENASEGLIYNRLNNLVSYRDLLHQVSKKKKLWPLRKLVSMYHQELFQLIPCWMASPESVSAIFPMASLFDLVIFDEASQCFSERGLPAMYRAKQVLIAGDGQQLKPNDLYQVRWSDDENENVDVEVESLLELAERYLPTVHLQGHYRSKSLELIEFSNRNFYGSRLRLLPDRENLNRQEPAIVYHKVDGVWENGTNSAEAEEVVQIIQDILEKEPSKEIGIVTFNASQQNLILDVLETSFQEKGVPIPETLFVKNIENVQGDEKDYIIFSVGYAADKKGKFSLQFGSLNLTGGENRLNVAVTRARERVIVVTSVSPEQFKTGKTKNAGPGLLRDYLEFARDVHERSWRLAPRSSNGRAGETLGKQLSAWGSERLNDFTFELHTLPQTDVNIRKSGQYLGVLLTDDERFRQSISIKDAFAYTPALLREKNWKYRYVYSRQYWKDPENLQQSLMTFIGGQST